MNPETFEESTVSKFASGMDTQKGGSSGAVGGGVVEEENPGGEFD